MTDSIFAKFKVWDQKKLTEQECRKIAAEQFEDLVETFDLDDNTFLEMYKTETPPSGQKIYCFRVIQGILPKGR